MDLVDEQNRRGASPEYRTAPGTVDDFTDILDPGIDGGEGEELTVQGTGDYSGKGSLSHTGRAPQYERGDVAALDHLPEDAAVTDKVFLTDIVGQVLRPHAFRKGRERVD